MKNKNNKSNLKLITDRCELPIKKGNGILSVSLLQDNKGKIIEYSFAYINTRICAKDNGRVIGYDNAHGHHHCHRMGQYEKVEFISYEATAELFEREWKEYHEKQ